MARTQATRARKDASAGRTEVRPGRKRPAAPRPGEGHQRELLALVLLGIGVFLAFVLLAGARGGFLGAISTGGLRVALGLMSFVVPLAFLAIAALLILDRRPDWASTWTLGGALLLLSLFLLLAAGFPPFGPGHDGQNFVRSVYEGRSGWVGELFYVAVMRLGGTVGVAIVGWLALVAGLSLVTGLSIKSAARGAGRAAAAVRTGAARRPWRRGEAEAEDGSDADRGPLDDPYLSGFGPQEEDISEEPTVSWGEPGVAAVPPAARVVDGARAFPDVFKDDTAGSAAQDGDPARNALPSALAEVETEPLGRRGAGAPGGTSIAEETAGDVRPESASHSTLHSGAGVSASGGGDQAGGGAPAQGTAQQRLPGLEAVSDTRGGAGWENGRRVYLLPETQVLRKSSPQGAADPQAERDTAAVLVDTLAQFGVEARVGGMVVGPRVTRFELQLAPGTKVAKVSALKDDLAYSLATTEIRILAPIPGKSAVGVEVPNQRPDFVALGDIYREFPRSAGPLMVWLGKDISGRAVYTDLTKLPHLLIAGTTGSGKSGCINCIISSVLLRATPDLVRMIMIDPKKVELSHYDRIPHLLVPVVTNMKNASGVLHNIVKEMDSRYELMELEHARSLEETNKARARRGEAPLPYIMIVIDELADLMMVSPAEVEEYIIRLAQKARAVGIHLVVATQRPSADVITGMIKANIPSRIAFAVSSQTDSRVILDVNGAESLLGMGDLLFKPLGSSRLQRIQGAYITETEIAMLVTHWRRQAEPEFQEELLQMPEKIRSEDEFLDPDYDDLLAEAAELVLDTGNASVSMLQRRLRVGYTRAGRLIDMLERRGIVGPYEGSKPRQILVNPHQREDILEPLQAGSRGSSLPARSFEPEAETDSAVPEE